MLLRSQPHSDNFLLGLHVVSSVSVASLGRYEDLAIRAGQPDGIQTGVVPPPRSCLNLQLHALDMVTWRTLPPRAPVSPSQLALDQGLITEIRRCIQHNA